MNPKEKKKEYDRLRYLLMKDEMLARNRAWRARNQEKIKKANRRWYLENRNRALAVTRLWVLNNRDKALARTRRHQLKILGQVHTSADMAKINAIYSSGRKLGLDVDHIIPICHGGWHHEDNMQLLPHDINCSKNSNPFWELEGYKSWRDVPERLWPENLRNKYIELKNQANA